MPSSRHGLPQNPTQVAVATSSETMVRFSRPSLTQLRTGTFTVATGQVAPDGTLGTAIAVGQPGAGFSLKRVRINGCTPSALDTALATAFLANG
jgi:hypothetical protein